LVITSAQALRRPRNLFRQRARRRQGSSGRAVKKSAAKKAKPSQRESQGAPKKKEESSQEKEREAPQEALTITFYLEREKSALTRMGWAEAYFGARRPLSAQGPVLSRGSIRGILRAFNTRVIGNRTLRERIAMFKSETSRPPSALCNFPSLVRAR